MFSKQLIIKLVNSIPSSSHEVYNNKLIYWDLDTKVTIAATDSIHKKNEKVLKYLLENPTAKNNYGEEILSKMMNEKIKVILSNVERDIDEFDSEKKLFKSDTDFYKYLRLDGYDIDFENKTLIEDIANYSGITEKNDNIIEFLDKYDFTTAKGHYEQAKGSYLGSNYAALNGQLRSFVEAIFQDMATYIKICENNNSTLSKINIIDANSSMQIMTKCLNPILDINLNEWDNDGKTYFPAFWKRLHPEGSHPGIPSFEETLYRFQLVVLNIEMLIGRFIKSYPKI